MADRWTEAYIIINGCLYSWRYCRALLAYSLKPLGCLHSLNFASDCPTIKKSRYAIACFKWIFMCVVECVVSASSLGHSQSFPALLVKIKVIRDLSTHCTVFLIPDNFNSCFFAVIKLCCYFITWLVWQPQWQLLPAANTERTGTSHCQPPDCCFWHFKTRISLPVSFRSCLTRRENFKSNNNNTFFLMSPYFAWYFIVLATIVFTINTVCLLPSRGLSLELLTRDIMQ